MKAKKILKNADFFFLSAKTSVHLHPHLADGARGVKSGLIMFLLLSLVVPC